MARKKKKSNKQNDVRGYGQAQPPPSKSSEEQILTEQQSIDNSDSKKCIEELTTDVAQGAVILTNVEDTKSSNSLINDNPKDNPKEGIISNTSAGRNAWASSNRFTSKLSGILDRLLDEWKFQTCHVEPAVAELGYSITLPSVLDWLCWNLSALELPTIFADGYLKNQEFDGTGKDNALDILQLAGRPSRISNLSTFSSATPNTHTQQHSTRTKIDMKENNHKGREQGQGVWDMETEGLKNRYYHQSSAMASRSKAWILENYSKYDESASWDDENRETDNNNEIVSDEPEITPATAKETKTSLSSSPMTATAALSTIAPTSTNGDIAETESQIATLSPEEEALIEQERLLEELVADLRNEANNYMRSKQEIKQLQNDVKTKKKLVAGIRRKIEKENATKKRQKEEVEEEATEKATALGTGIEDNEGEADFIDLFGGAGKDDDDNDDGTVEAKKSATVPEIPQETEIDRKFLLNGVIAKSWTGTTPQTTLYERCKKKSVPRPKYIKLPENQGYRLCVKWQKEERTWIAYANDFVAGSSLQDYLATQALYEMDPTLPLDRLLPAAFADVWSSWKKAEKDAEDQRLLAIDEAKQQRLEHFLSLIDSRQENSDRSQQALGGSSLEKEKGQTLDDPELQESNTQEWDDQSNRNCVPAVSHRPSERGRGLQREFERRIQSTDYQKMLDIRSNLPVATFRSEILDTISKHPVTILSAQTGAGKTTQCPQYLLEEALSTGLGDKTQILVTQPRRVAATSVAERVSEELCESRLGRWVGYRIRMESKCSADTMLQFCTTGIVLRRLQDDRNLSGVTHVVVDEVHERQQQTDVLLVALRQLLQTTRPDLKVILMSATMDSDLFCSFFGSAPLISIPGRTYPVNSYHLEDLMDATDHVISPDSVYAIREKREPSSKATLWVTNRGGDKRREVVDVQPDDDAVSDLYPGYKMSTRRSMDRVKEDVINYDLLEDILQLILCQHDKNATLLPPKGADLSKGSVLVFLPGLGEIRTMAERLEGNRQFQNPRKFEIVAMHSTLAPKDQRRAFIPSIAGCRKIILSTNIAETSVTIPDVVCVIDSGRVREVRRNKRTSTSILETDWCSKASAKQRAGRAGRVQPGVCLKLYSSYTASKVMKATSEPELLRVPLEEVCLSILASGFTTNSMDFLSQAPQPPPQQSVYAAVAMLEDVGAIEVEEGSALSKQRVERLTPLGRHLAKLPVDVKIGKTLIFGALFQCLDKILTIAACLSCQSPFSTYIMDADLAKAKRLAFSDPDSDFLTLCNVWESYWVVAKESTSAGRKYCLGNFLNFMAMREIGDARRQYLDLLCSIGIVDRDKLVANDHGGSKNNQNSKTTQMYSDTIALQESYYNQNGIHSMDLIHSVIAAGLYPNVARLEQPVSKPTYTLYHRQERLHFHKSSVNSRKKCFPTNTVTWIVFYEKFGTPQRVSISTTSFVDPIALLLLGGSNFEVQHLDRRVTLDGWIDVQMSPQVGVTIREVRKQIQSLLLEQMNGVETAVQGEANSMKTEDLIQGLVKILTSKS